MPPTPLKVYAQLFHALSDDLRLHIVERLAHKTCCVRELQEWLDVDQPQVSFHLRALKVTGLAIPRKDPPFVFYELNQGKLVDMATFLQTLRPGGRALYCALACCHPL